MASNEHGPRQPEAPRRTRVLAKDSSDGASPARIACGETSTARERLRLWYRQRTMANQAPSSPAPNALHVAVTWGTTVMALRTLARGETFRLGDAPGSSLPIPEGVEMNQTPLRAAASGWELEARGCLGGLLTLRGRAEDPVAVARMGAPVVIMPGDFGLIQYGQLALFFQYTTQPRGRRALRGPELLVLLAGLCSAILHVGGLLLLATLSTPLPYPKPPELESPDELAARFKVKRAALELRSTSVSDGDEDTGTDERAEPPEAKRDERGGEVPRVDKGTRGVSKTARRAGSAGVAIGLGEALDGDTGRHIKGTLESIATVSRALSGLSSEDIVLGSGPGAGLKGAVEGRAVYGTGTLDTGFGAAARAAEGAEDVGRRRPGARGGVREAKVTVAGTSVTNGGLSPEQIRRVVMSHIGAVRACYETEAQRNPTLEGSVTLQWQIDPGGVVTTASIGASTLSSPRVEGCILRQVKRWKFPASDAPTTVAGFPFKFGVGG